MPWEPQTEAVKCESDDPEELEKQRVLRLKTLEMGNVEDEAGDKNKCIPL